MKRKMIITKTGTHIITAVLENEEIAELHLTEESEKMKHVLGNIYVGKVKKVVPNINAAFIEIAKGVECYYSLSENEKPLFTHKIGKKPLCAGDELLVQITKEAVKTKAQTVSGNLSFQGKYVVLTTGNSKIGVSSKIFRERRAELLDWMKEFEGDTYGFVVRTNAKEITKDELTKEVRRLIGECDALREAAALRTCFSCLKRAPKPYIAELRNIYTEGLSDIIVEGDTLHEEVRHFLQTEQPKDLEKLRKYEDSLLPLHKLYHLEHTIAEAMKERVWMKSGAYLVIQPTEALTVIDVNTGKCVTKKDAEETYYRINLEAAKEAAKQIRLRNLSGIILIDFINLKRKEQTESLLLTLESCLKKDPVPTTLVDVTGLQLVEITRKKIKKPLREAAAGIFVQNGRGLECQKKK